jgi:hypothetical protein
MKKLVVTIFSLVILVSCNVHEYNDFKYETIIQEIDKDIFVTIRTQGTSESINGNPAIDIGISVEDRISTHSSSSTEPKVYIRSFYYQQGNDPKVLLLRDFEGRSWSSFEDYNNEQRSGNAYIIDYKGYDTKRGNCNKAIYKSDLFLNVEAEIELYGKKYIVQQKLKPTNDKTRFVDFSLIKFLLGMPYK